MLSLCGMPGRLGIPNFRGKMALRAFVERKTVPLSCVTSTSLDSITGAAASALYRMDDDDNTEAFWIQVLASRQSVAARGRRTRPLASEYAIATAPERGSDEGGVPVLCATFERFVATGDDALGRPGHDTRLIPRRVGTVLPILCTPLVTHLTS